MDILALGEALIDFTVSSTDSDGYPVLKANPGGAPANFLAAAAAFGCSTALIAKVGTDAFGRLLINSMRKYGIDADAMISDERFFTTLAFVTLHPKTGERQFSFARKPGADTQLCWNEISTSAIDKAKVFHFGTLSLTASPSRDATQKAVAYAKRAGKLISFDPNLRPPLWDDLNDAREMMLWGLRHADIVKISDDEIDFLYQCPVDEGIQLIRQSYGSKLIWGTMGREGCFFAAGGVSGFCPAFQVRSVDATGAGDIFGGTALALLLKREKPLQDCSASELADIAKTASAAAALSTGRFDGISSICSKETVLDFVAQEAAK